MEASVWTSELLAELRSNKELLATGDVDSDDSSGSDSSPSDDALDDATMAEVVPFKFLRRRTGCRRPKKAVETSPVKKEPPAFSPVAKKRVKKAEIIDRKPEVNPIARIHYQNRNLIRSSLGRGEPRREPAATPPRVVMVDAATQTDNVPISQVS